MATTTSDRYNGHSSWSEAVVERALRIAFDHNSYRASRETGVPYSTIRDWVRDRTWSEEHAPSGHDAVPSAVAMMFPVGSSVTYTMGYETRRGLVDGPPYRGLLHPETIYVPVSIDHARGRSSRDGYPIDNLRPAWS